MKIQIKLPTKSAKPKKAVKTTPDKKTTSKEFIIIYAILISLVLFFLVLHAVTVSVENPENGIIMNLLLAISHAVQHPLTIKLNRNFFFYLFFVSFVAITSGAMIYLDIIKHKRDPKAKGEAKWSENMDKYNDSFVDKEHPFNNMILTQNVMLSMNSSKTRRNNNILVVGGSGSGKTRFMIKPNILQANCSFVITDPKGEILEAEGEMLKKHGYKIKVFNLTDMDHSNSYNPFEYIRDDLGVLMMINCLIKNTNNGQKSGGDPFWEKSETMLLQALVFYLRTKKGISDEEKNFSQVMKLLRLAEVDENNPNAESPLDKKFAELEREDPNNIGVKQYKSFKMGAGKTLKSILISVAVRLTVFNLEKIANLTMKDDMDLKSMGDEKTALFVVIPAADDTYNFLVSMMYSQLFETLYYRAENECLNEYWIQSGTDILAIAPQTKREIKDAAKRKEQTRKDAEKLLKGLKFARPKKQKNGKVILKAGNTVKEFASKELYDEYSAKLANAKIVEGRIRLPIPVRFLLDEFANIGQIPEFTKKLATMRQYEISCTIILQNLAQIKTMYKDDWESIVGNCDSFLFLGGQEYSTLEYISKLLGKTTVISGSVSRQSKGGYSRSYSGDAKDLMSTDRIATMPKSDCILIINGLDPFYGPKYDLLKHPHYAESGDADPNLKYKYKDEIFNYSARQKDSAQRPSINADPTINATAYKKLEDVLKDGNVKESMAITTDNTYLVEKKNENGEPEFDYSFI